MLHQLIRESTKFQHADLEDLMYVEEIMNGSLGYEQYKHMLITNYLITAEYETQLLQNLDSGIAMRLDVHKRIKIEALLKDIGEVNLDINDFKITTGFVTDSEHALGCLYVLEGATLGGNMIVKKLKENRHLKPYNLQFYYYQVYGEQLISYWKQFCEVINEQPEHNYSKIIEGAKFMYSEFMALQLAK